MPSWTAYNLEPPRYDALVRWLDESTVPGRRFTARLRELPAGCEMGWLMWALSGIERMRIDDSVA